MADSSYATAAFGWAVVATAATAGYFYYARDSAKKKSIKPTPKRVEDAQTIEPKSRPKKNKPTTTLKTPSISITPSNDPEEKEDTSWVAALADKQKGTTLTSSKKEVSKKKTVKQASANKVAAELSKETSTNGDDADDDLSQSSMEHRTAGDISDMLETPASGPSVLRITEPEHQLPKKQKEKKAPAQEETKKQRQNRKKAEEKKALREAEEKGRRQLEEAQRRTARESRGEPAKNGVAPASSAWQQAKPSKANGSANGSSNGALLDTFDAEPKTEPKIEPKTEPKWTGNALPDEEEQIRLLAENDESSWMTVSKAKKKKPEGGAVQGVNSGSE